MQISVENMNSVSRNIKISYAANDFDNELNKKLIEILKTAKIPGYRKGSKNFPPHLKEKFKKQAEMDAVNALINKAIQHFRIQLQEEDPSIKLVGSPTVTSIDSVGEGKTFEFTATIEHLPKIQLADLATLELEKIELNIQDSDVDDVVNNLRKQMKTWKEVDRPIQEGDKVEINFVGTLDGVPFEGGSAENATLEIGSKQFIEGFETGLIGHKTGEKVILNLTFPTEYHAENLAGKATQFEVTINKVMEGELPELNEEFIKKLGIENGSEQDLRNQMKEHMSSWVSDLIAKHQSRQVFEKLREAHSFEIPQSLIDDEVQRLHDELYHDKAHDHANHNEEELERWKETASIRVSNGLIFEVITKHFGLEPNYEEVKQAIFDAAKTYAEPAEFLKYIEQNPSKRREFAMLALEKKVIQTVLDQAKTSLRTANYKDALEEFGGFNFGNML